MIDRRNYREAGDPIDAPTGNAQESPSAPKSEGRDRRLAHWFKQWRKPIRHWLSSRASVPAADLDDLAQEVFLRLLRYSDDVAVENPLGYLLRIAANVANEWRDRARVSQPHDQSWLDDLLIEPDEEPENSLAQARTNECLQAAVDKLPRRQREALLLRLNEGLTYKQIADRLGLTQRAVLRDLTRAYAQLRVRLKPEDLK